MPVNLPENLPAKETLKKEHIFLVERDRSNNELAENGYHSPCQYRRGIRVDPKMSTS